VPWLVIVLDAAAATALSDNAAPLGPLRLLSDRITLSPEMGRLVLHQRVVRCVECPRVWRFLNGERWRAYRIDDGPEEKLLFYCPECSEREFGRR
jgi:hypothetical protein